MPGSDKVVVLLADMEECQYCAVMNIPKCLVMKFEYHQFTNTINLLPTIKSGDSITKVVILQQYNLQNDHLSIQSTKQYNLHNELSSMI